GDLREIDPDLGCKVGIATERGLDDVGELGAAEVVQGEDRLRQAGIERIGERSSVLVNGLRAAVESDVADELHLAEVTGRIGRMEPAEIVLLVGEAERKEQDLAVRSRRDVVGAAETDADRDRDRIRVGDEIEALLVVDAEAEMQMPLERDRRMQVGRYV